MRFVTKCLYYCALFFALEKKLAGCATVEIYIKKFSYFPRLMKKRVYINCKAMQEAHVPSKSAEHNLIGSCSNLSAISYCIASNVNLASTSLIFRISAYFPAFRIPCTLNFPKIKFFYNHHFRDTTPYRNCFTLKIYRQ